MTLGRAELIYRDNFPVRLVFCGVLIHFKQSIHSRLRL